MMVVWLVALGGALGSVARYGLASSIQKAFGPTFPLGTVVVNVLGCLVIGFLYVFLVERTIAKPEMRGFFMVGIMGGFTTFSSFSLETITLMMQAQYVRAVLNVVVSVGACLLATGLGIWLARI